MTVNNQEVERITIVGRNGITIEVTESPKGNLRITEIGKYIQTLSVIPQSSNSLIITSSREMY